MQSHSLCSHCNSGDYIETEHGGFIVAINISKVTDRKKYDASIKSLNEEVRTQKPKNGIDKIVVPGDRNLGNKAGISDDVEIDVDEKYQSDLETLASIK